MSGSVATPAAPAGREDVRTIAAVSSAHFVSHVLQLALAPLLPLISADLGIGFVELGLVLTAHFAASGAGQVVAGILVDRFGAPRLLIGGVALQATAIGCMGLFPNYTALILLGAVAGLGNSVYHPADLSILSRSISPQRLGRAFAAHVLAGQLGFAASPIAMGMLASFWNWRIALMVGSAFGLTVALGLILNRETLSHAPLRRPMPGAATADAPGAPGLAFLHILLMPVVLLSFGYFVLTALSGTGIATFAITAFNHGYGASLAMAALAVTIYQLSSASGVFLGGILADRVQHHHRVAMTGLATAAVLMGLVAAVAPAFWPAVLLLAAAGCSSGITMPSRDVLVRRAAPSGGLGKVFGIVYSGFDVGSLLGPLIYGVILDRYAPWLVFACAAIPLAFAIPTVLGVTVKGRKS